MQAPVARVCVRAAAVAVSTGVCASQPPSEYQSINVTPVAMIPFPGGYHANVQTTSLLRCYRDETSPNPCWPIRIYLEATLKTPLIR